MKTPKFPQAVTTRPQPARLARAPVAAETRRKMIEEGAYYRALRRGLKGGDAVTDWIEAEREIDGRLKGAA